VLTRPAQPARRGFGQSRRSRIEPSLRKAARRLLIATVAENTATAPWSGFAR
jgi:hypothetical protein